MHTSQNYDWRAMIDRLYVIDRKVDREVESAIGNRRWHLVFRDLDVGDFLKALGVQQFLSSEGFRRRAGAPPGHPYGGGFESPFGGPHARNMEQARHPRRGERSQKAASRLG